MAKFFDLTFSVKEVIYLLGAVGSFMFGITKITTVTENHEYRISALEKGRTELTLKVDNYIYSNNEVNANNKNNFYKFNAILPKETKIEIE